MNREIINQTLLTYLMNHAPVFVMLLDRGGKVVMVNGYARELVGGDVGLKTFGDVFVDFAKSLKLSVLTEDPEKAHLLNVTTYTGLPETLYFHFMDLGDSILALGKPDTREFESLRKDLIILNNELTNATRELQKRNAELAQLNDMKNLFLGMASHDLRIPLNIILNYSEFILDEAAHVLHEEHLNFLRTIISSTKQMKRLIDDFLDIAAIESGKLPMDIKQNDISAVLHNSLMANNSIAQRKQVQLVTTYGDHIPMLMIDGFRIEQVFNNLITNAIEYTKENSVVAIQITRKNGEVIVSVRDEGHGIATEDVARLFKPFSGTSVKKVKKSSGEKSTGLGLTISRKIIEAHKGKIWMESDIGKGTTFYFSLPIQGTH